jgi:arabinose-5-phosphate isomerase
MQAMQSVTNNKITDEAEVRALATLTAARKALASLAISQDFIRAIDLLSGCKGKVVFIGMGKSSYIAMKLAATFTSLGHPAVYLHPVEALHGDSGLVAQEDCIIALSHSGETAEVVKIVSYLKKHFSISVISITGTAESSLAKVSDVILMNSVADEGAPVGDAPMASSTATLVIGDMLASALTSPEQFQDSHFIKFHPGGSLALRIKKVKDLMKSGTALPLIAETALFQEALEVLGAKRLGVVGVVNKTNELIGVVTDGDVRRALIKHEVPLKLAAKDLMTKQPKVISPDTSLEEALRDMEKYKITQLFVIENNRPYGHHSYP